MADSTASDLRDRYRGCLTGLAVGDALGAPLEFLIRAEIEQRFGRLREMIGGGWLEVRPGEYTDDTQMTLAIARSIAERGTVDPADIAERFIAWYHSMPKDIGNTTRRAIAHLVDGVPWNEAGTRVSAELHGRDAGNGSLMRCAPLALACRPDPVALARASRDVSRVTHANPLATEACVALNLVLVRLLDGHTDVLDIATEVSQPEVRAAVAAVPHLAREDVRSGGYVLDTLQAALWSFVRHSNVEEVVVEAVNLGGDADTTGAVAGALAGAAYGLAGIPVRWLDVLEGRDELIALADRLLEVSEAQR